MLLETAIEEAMKRSTTLRGATRRLANMFEAGVVEYDETHYYWVRPYVVRGHKCRRRRSFRVIETGKLRHATR
jgi:hypothetical protein